MPHYMLRWQINTDSAKNFVAKPQDRTKAATTLIEGFGGKLLSYYFALGEYDGEGVEGEVYAAERVADDFATLPYHPVHH